MKKKILYACLVGTLTVLCALFLFSCGTKDTEREFDHRVTFNYNYGKLDVECPEQYLGVKDGGKVAIMPGNNENFKLYEVPGYYLEGWYLPKTSESGAPLTDEASGMVLLDRKWNFGTDTVSGDMTLYARLIHQSVLSFRDVDTGEVVSTIKGNPGTSRQEPSTTLAPKKDGHTLLGYFTDEACTQPFAFPYTFEETDRTVYVKFLEGNWQVVRSTGDFFSGIRNNQNLWITGDLDFTGVKWLSLDYNATIAGNGCTLRGITVEQDGTKTYTAGFGLFNRLGAKAQMTDLTFEDVAIRFTAQVTGTFHVAPLAQEVSGTARIERVRMTGTLTYDIAKAPTSVIYPLVAMKTVPDVFTDCTFTITLADANAAGE